MTYLDSRTIRSVLSALSASSAILTGALACQSPPPAAQTAAPGTSAPSGEEPGSSDAGATSAAAAAPGNADRAKPSPGKTAEPEVLDGGEGLALTRGAQKTGQLRVSLRGIEVPEGTNAPQVILGMRDGLQSCYEKATAAGSKWQGTADVQLKLAASGAVESATVANAESGFPETLGRCVRDRVKGARFDGKTPKELKFTAVFKTVP